VRRVDLALEARGTRAAARVAGGAARSIDWPAGGVLPIGGGFDEIDTGEVALENGAIVLTVLRGDQRLRYAIRGTPGNEYIYDPWLPAEGAGRHRLQLAADGFLYAVRGSDPFPARELAAQPNGYPIHPVPAS
jgi:hypothetical protein